MTDPAARFARGRKGLVRSLSWAGAALLGLVLACSWRPRTVEEELAGNKPALANYYAQTALRLETEGQYEAAAEYYRKAVRLVPYDPDLHNNLGACYYHVGKLDSAVTEFQEAIRLLPSYSPGYVNLANAYRLQKRLDLALQAAREALRIEPTEARAHTALGLVQEELGQIQEARKAYEVAVRLAPSDPVARWNLGRTYLRLGYLNPAIENLEQAVGGEGGNYKARYLLAVARLTKCDTRGALEELAWLEGRPPWRREAANLKGIAYWLQGSPENALGCFLEATEIAPHVPEFRYNAAAALVALGRVEGAQKQLEEALRIDPRCARALLGLGEIRERAGDRKAALRYYREAAAADSLSFLPWQRLGRVWIDLGEVDSGRAALERALGLWGKGKEGGRLASGRVPTVDEWDFCLGPEESRRQLAEAYLYLGKAYAALGNQKAADNALRRALQERPIYPEAYETLAEVHRLFGRVSEASRERALAYWARGVQAMERDSLTAALRWFRSALELVPGLSEAYVDLGRLLLLRGQVDSALLCLRQGVSLDDRLTRGFRYLADCYVQKGSLEEAIPYYLRAISGEEEPLEALRGLAQVYLELGSGEEAARMRAQAHFLAGKGLLRESRTDRALDEFLQAIRFNPRHFGALLLLGVILHQRGFGESAVDFLSRAVRIDSAHAEARYALGTALLDQGRVQEAAAHLEAAVRLDPSLARAYFQLARAYLEAGQVDRARQRLRDAEALGHPVPAEFVRRLRDAGRPVER
ncbi:MAG: tetratricopeptide repeat protein [candidate division KSB1 bacterium]|nr:tetratricopeptide repeat protein [candidate division KSB1 bacterium]